MNRGRLAAWLVGVTVVVVALLVWMTVFGARPRLGLDLRGGISVILTPVAVEGTDIPDDVLNETIEIIRSRVDALGVAEPEIARQGDDILVQLPGIEDRQRALDVIGQTAELGFRPVLATYPPGTPQYTEVGPDCTPDEDENPAAQPTPIDTLSPSPAPTATPDAASSPEPAPSVTAAGEAPSPAPSPEVSPAPAPSPTTSPGGGTPPAGETEILCGTTLPDDPETEQDESALPPVKYEVGPPALTGTAVEDAVGQPEQTAAGGVTNNWLVLLELTDEGARQFAQITSELACQRDQGSPGGGQLAIVLDEVVESAPTMAPQVQCGVGISGGQAQITVGGDQQEALDLALVLRTGALPITLEPSTAFNVSATLGAQAMRAGIIAGFIGLGLVALYLIAFYRWLGVVSVGALAVFGVGIFGLVTLLGEVGFTLTLAGIAGIIVSIGIAADSGILYFERIRDELDAGRTVRSAVVRSFQPAFRTNLTGNTATIAAAIILYFLAVGPVRGFAFTLGLSTALDLVILYAFTRPAVQLLGGTKLLRRRGARVAVEPQPSGGTR